MRDMRENKRDKIDDASEISFWFFNGDGGPRARTRASRGCRQRGLSGEIFVSDCVSNEKFASLDPSGKFHNFDMGLLHFCDDLKIPISFPPLAMIPNDGF